jgi:hypothetical protein
MDFPVSERIQVSVFHISGSLMMNLSPTPGNPFTLDVSRLDPGIYILRIRRGQRTANQRFIIAR